MHPTSRHCVWGASELEVRVALGGGTRFDRHLLRLLVSGADVPVVAEAPSTDELVSLSVAERPDVVVLLLVTSSDRRAIRDLAALGCSVLVVASDATPGMAMDILRAGAAGYITAQVGPDQLVAALRDVQAGGAPVDPMCAGPLVAEWRRLRGDRDEVARDLAPLSQRELDVLSLLAAGETTKSASRLLDLSAKTVENHKTRIFSKMGVRNQAQAVALAVASGILDGPESRTRNERR